MSKITLSPVKTCLHDGCDKLGVCKDKKCLDHSSLYGTTVYSYEHRKYREDCQPTPQSMKIKGRAVGVEIECYPAQERCDALPHIRYWKSDCSLERNGREMIICAPEKSAGRVVGEVLRALEETGGYVNSSCGFHVHTSNDYNDTTYNRLRDVKEILRSKIFTDYFQDRSQMYVGPSNWLCYKSRTIENRTHPATLNPHAMIAWIDVCRKIQDYVDTGCHTLYKKWSKNGQLIDGFRANSYAYKYLKSRLDNNGHMPNNFSLA